VTQHRKPGPGIPPGATRPAGMTAASRASTARRSAFRDTAALYAAVAAGSVIGAVLRALASLALHDHLGSGFPWGTLFVNVTGSFAIGFYATLTGPDGRVFVGARQRQFIMTGICGGYTTFSAFSLETFRFLQAGDLSAAGLNICVSVTSWLVAVWLGHMLATRLNRLKG
jgi:CrcB protein